jgi:hypothetical protein
MKTYTVINKDPQTLQTYFFEFDFRRTANKFIKSSKEIGLISWAYNYKQPKDKATAQSLNQ